MKTLFFRLFLSFLTAILISLTIFFTLLFQIKERLLLPPHHTAGNHLRIEKPLYPLPSTHRPEDNAPRPHFRHRPPPPRFFIDLGFQALIFLIVGGIICYLLAWRFTIPVRRLRSTVQRFAGGDLTARTEVGTQGKGDEIADLGRDFDRMAERIEVLVSSQKQLVRDISHELRSPLARLNVALGLARREASPASESALDRIELESERLNAMIGELLTLTMLESGSVAAEKSGMDLAELVVEVAQDADFEAAHGNRRVMADAPASGMVNGNRELLRRALENIVRNGIRYTADGTAVEISLQDDGSGTAVIRTRDHGPGVPEEELSEIFRPFYRVAKDRDRLSGGAGIGLAITERAIKLHGGTVSAANHDKGGLEVTIRLPLCSGNEH